MLITIVLSYLVIPLVRKVFAVPPAACHAPFRWDDCGKDPTPVMYYWKSGSRCEVGMWRGCLPNINMFPDEYECVATCIFSARARMEDYHAFNEIEEDSDEITKDPYDIHERPVHNATNNTAGDYTESDTTGDDGTEGGNATTGAPSESGADSDGTSTGAADDNTDGATSDTAGGDTGATSDPDGGNTDAGDPTPEPTTEAGGEDKKK